jgi:hypothetical protein
MEGNLTEEQRKKLQELKSRYENLLNKSEGNFNDIATNLMIGLEAVDRLSAREDFRKRGEHYIKALESYFDLIEEFPEFEEREFLLPYGAFPDLRKRASAIESKPEQKRLFGWSTAHAHYVYLSEQRLKS